MEKYIGSGKDFAAGSSVAVRITPPAYTHKPTRKQDKFTLEAEEGSVVSLETAFECGRKGSGA